MKTSLFLVLLLSPLLFAIGNIIDSYLVTKYGGDEEDNGNIAGLLVIGSFFAFLTCVFIFLFSSKEIFRFDLSSSLALVFTGVLSVLTLYLYLKALKEDHVTTVMVWAQTIPFFAYVLGFIFLGESLSTLQIIGGVIVIIGSLIVGIDDPEEITFKKVFGKKVVLFMLGACFCYAVVTLIFKMQTLADSLYWSATFYENIGVFLIGTLIYFFYKKSRPTLHSFFSKKEPGLLLLNSFNEVVFLAATFITQFVVLSIPLVIVTLADGLRPVFVFVLGLLFAVVFPGRIKDLDTSKRNLIKNIVGIVLSIVGIMLLR